MDAGDLLNTILVKLMIGCRDWSLDELQFQHNNPDMIEKGLRSYPYNVIAVPADTTLLEHVSINKYSKNVCRTIANTSAVLLSLYYNSDVEGNIAVVYVGQTFMEIGISWVGSGIFESKCTRLVGKNEDMYGACRSAIANSEIDGNLNELNIVYCNEDAKLRDNMDVSIIEKAFGRKALVRTDGAELCVRGAYIQSGILEGLVKDTLLMESTPFDIYCEYGGGEHILLVEANTIIPCRKTVKLVVPQNKPINRLFVKEEDRIIAVLPLEKADSKEEVEYKITAEITSGKECGITVEKL